MVQPMPLPLTVSCKIQIGFYFLVPAHPGSPGQRAVKRVCVCVCVEICTIHYSSEISCFVTTDMMGRGRNFRQQAQTEHPPSTGCAARRWYTEVRRVIPVWSVPHWHAGKCSDVKRDQRRSIRTWFYKQAWKSGLIFLFSYWRVSAAVLHQQVCVTTRSMMRTLVHLFLR